MKRTKEGIRKVPSFFFFQGGKYHSLVGKLTNIHNYIADYQCKI